MNQPDLMHLQEWLQSLITHPQKSGLCGTGTQGEPKHIIQSKSGLNAEARVGIYSRAYRARLHESLQQQFPVLLEVLEPKLFDCFVEGFIRACPPSGHSLLELGAGFAKWLNDTRPANETWAQFIGEVATLERLREEVYHGPGHESQMPDGKSAWDTCLTVPVSLKPSPSFRLMRAHYPVDTYYEAVRSGRTPERPEATTTHIGIYRQNWQVHLFRLSEAAMACWKQIKNGCAFSKIETGHQIRIFRWLDQGILVKNQ